LIRKLAFLGVLLSLLLAGCATTDEISPLARQSYNLGNALSRLGEFQQAEQAYLTALNLYPDYHDAAYNLILLYIHRQKYEQALDSIESYRGQEGFLELEAYLSAVSGNTEQALELYAQLAERDGDYTWKLKRIEVLIDAQSYQQAEAEALELVQARVTDAQLYYLLGRIEQLRESSDGMDWFASALLADPSHEQALEVLRSVYETDDAPVELRRELAGLLDKAVKKHPEHAGIQFWTGKNLLLLGETSGLEHVRRSYELGSLADSQFVDLYDLLESSESELSRKYAELLEELGVVVIIQPSSGESKLSGQGLPG
jgi:tetratricopeptide (TPR) repeat protein